MDVMTYAKSAQPDVDTKIKDKAALKLKNLAESAAPKYAEAPPTPMAQIALLTDTLQLHGYKPTPQNLQLLTSMLDAGIPLTKENIASMNKAFKMTQNIEQALFLFKNEIPSTPKNTTVLNDMAQGGAKISHQIDTILESIAKMPDSPIKDKIIKLFEGFDTTETQASEKAVKEQQGQDKMPKPVPVKIQPQAMPKATPASPTVQIAQSAPAKGFIPTPTLPQANAQATPVPPAPPTYPTAQAPTTQAAPTPTLTAPTQAYLNFESQPVSQPTQPQQPTQVSQPSKEAAPLPPQQPALPEGLPADTVTGRTETINLPENLSDLRTKLAVPLQTSSVQEMENFINNLREIIKEAQVILATAEDAQGATPGADASQTATVSRSFAALADYIDFTNQIKNQTFVEVPIIVNDQQFNTALYVKKDGANSQKNKTGSSGSALVALDTAFLGHFETYVQKDSQAVHLQFRLEDEEIEQLVRANIHRLDNLLKDKKYNLESFSFLIGDRPFTVLDALGEANGADKKQRLDTVFDAMA